MLKNKGVITDSATLLRIANASEQDRNVREYNIFDDWAKKHKKLFLKTQNFQMCCYSVAKEYLLAIKSNAKEEFFVKRKEKIKKEFFDDVKVSVVDSINNYRFELAKCEIVKNKALELKDWCDEFENGVKEVKKAVSKLHTGDLKNILVNYLKDKKFDRKEIENIIRKRYVLADFLFRFFSIWDARQCFKNFMEKYEDDNSYQEAQDLAKMYYGVDVGYIVFSKIETIANLDFETSDIWSAKLIYELKKLDEDVIKIAKDIEAKEKMLKKIESDFEASKLFDEERKLIDKYFLKRKK